MTSSLRVALRPALIVAAVLLAGAAVLLVALTRDGAGPAPASASSHREAPAITEDPSADNTDMYAFRSPDAPNFLTIISNVQGLQDPAAGPNYYRFSSTARYKINIDRNGDAIPDLVYTYRFFDKPGKFFLGNTEQGYTVTKTENGKSTVVANATTATNNIGPRSTPNYQTVSLKRVKALRGGGKTFAGQREDPFYFDSGATFDLVAIRKGIGNQGGGRDFFAGYGVDTMAIQIPLSQLKAKNDTVGIYASVERQTVAVGQSKGRGAFKQVSRFGNPLNNELITPTSLKDKWNRSKPINDKQFATFGLNPILAKVINKLYPTVKAPETNRTDLAQIFFTGIPKVNFTGNTLADLMRIKLKGPITPVGKQKRLGLLAGDPDGYPNGRRLGDDVIDITEQAVAGALKGNKVPLGDGVNGNDVKFLTKFPYLQGVSSGFANTKGEPYRGSAAATSPSSAG